MRARSEWYWMAADCIRKTPCYALQVHEAWKKTQCLLIFLLLPNCTLQSIYEDAKLMASYSGFIIPDSFTSKTNEIELVFTSNRRRRFSGFVAKFYSIPGSRFPFEKDFCNLDLIKNITTKMCLHTI